MQFRTTFLFEASANSQPIKWEIYHSVMVKPVSKSVIKLKCKLCARNVDLNCIQHPGTCCNVRVAYDYDVCIVVDQWYIRIGIRMKGRPLQYKTNLHPSFATECEAKAYMDTIVLSADFGDRPMDLVAKHAHRKVRKLTREQNVKGPSGPEFLATLSNIRATKPGSAITNTIQRFSYEARRAAAAMVLSKFFKKDERAGRRRRWILSTVKQAWSFKESMCTDDIDHLQKTLKHCDDQVDGKNAYTFRVAATLLDSNKDYRCVFDAEILSGEVEPVTATQMLRLNTQAMTILAVSRCYKQKIGDVLKIIEDVAKPDSIDIETFIKLEDKLKAAKKQATLEIVTDAVAPLLGFVTTTTLEWYRQWRNGGFSADERGKHKRNTLLNEESLVLAMQ